MTPANQEAAKRERYIVAPTRLPLLLHKSVCAMGWNWNSSARQLLPRTMLQARSLLELRIRWRDVRVILGLKLRSRHASIQFHLVPAAGDPRAFSVRPAERSVKRAMP